MTANNNQRIVLAARPVGKPRPSDFRIEDAPLPEVGEGELLLETLYLSLDPYMRGRMDDRRSYSKPVGIGETMVGGTVSRVARSRNAAFAEGDIVLGASGWQRYAISDGKSLSKLDPNAAPLTAALGVLGMPGFTAYSGLKIIGAPKSGETVVVAAATGPVGSAVAQLARIWGARPVAIAGGAEKCAWLKREIGLEHVIDHRAPDFPDALAKACPNGIDIYFENVGGKVFAAVMPLLNDFARIPVCGIVGDYNLAEPPPGPDRVPGLMRLILTRRLTFRGFIQREFMALKGEFDREMPVWIKAGKVKYLEDVVDGLAKAPEAFIGLLDGKNFGKVVVKVSA